MSETVDPIKTTKSSSKEDFQRPKRYHVLLHNDDYTPAEYVVHLLNKHFNMSTDQAFNVMLAVHQDGTGIIDTFPKDVAETKAELATTEAASEGHPTLFSAEAE